MGRGLSPLQQWILEEVRSKREQASGAGRLYYSEICSGYFGWTSAPGVWRNGVGSQQFSKASIGEAEYSRVQTTISRSCRRLRERGLVTCLQGLHSHWSGVEITETGLEVIGSLKGHMATESTDSIDQRIGVLPPDTDDHE